MAHSSTLKHLHGLLRRDFLPIPWPFLSPLNPPKRGAPGVPGVAGVEGRDAASSFSIIARKRRIGRRLIIIMMWVWFGLASLYDL